MASDGETKLRNRNVTKESTSSSSKKQLPEDEDTFLYSQKDVAHIQKRIVKPNCKSIVSIINYAIISRIIVCFLIIAFPVFIGRDIAEADFQHLNDQWMPTVVTKKDIHWTPGSDPYFDYYYDAPYTYRPTLQPFFDSFPSVQRAKTDTSKCSAEGFEVVPKDIPGSKLLFKYPSVALTGFQSWDAALNLEIATFGYHTEKMFAFFPMIPFLARHLSYILVTFLPSIFGDWCVRPLLSFSGVIINNMVFAITAVVLYILSLRVTKSERVSKIASLLFVFNPAAVFYSAVYTESIFNFLSIAGLLFLSLSVTSNPETSNVLNIFTFIRYHTCRWAAAITFFLASSCRSNGAVLFAFLLFDPAKDMLYYICTYLFGQSTKTPTSVSLKTAGKKNNKFLRFSLLLTSLFFLVLQLPMSLIPSSAFQMMAHSIHCGAWKSYDENIMAIRTDNPKFANSPFVSVPPPYCDVSTAKSVKIPMDHPVATVFAPVISTFQSYFQEMAKFVPAANVHTKPSLDLPQSFVAPTTDNMLKYPVFPNIAQESATSTKFSFLSPVPPVYASLQVRYWGLGLFKTFELKQTPNFLLAAPVIIFVFLSLIPFFKTRVIESAKKICSKANNSNSSVNVGSKLTQFWVWLAQIAGPAPFIEMPVPSSSKKETNEKDSSKTSSEQYQLQLSYEDIPHASPEAVVYQGHLAGLWIIAITYMHIQVSTRFLSGCPALYWYLATVYLSSKCSFLKLGLIAWCVGFTFAGCLLFSMFFPWT